MARTKNNFLNAKPVSKMGGGSGGVRKPGKPYSKPPASTKATPKVKAKAAKPTPKPVAPTVKGPVPRPGLQNRGGITAKDLLPNSDRRGGNLPKAGAQALRSRTQGPKAPTTSKAPKVVTKPVTRSGPVKGPVPPKGSSPVTMPNSRRAGVNLPQAGARAERTAQRVMDLKRASASKTSTPKPAKTPLLRGAFGQGAGALQLGLMGAELATQAGYARGGKNYKEFVRAQDRVPAKPAAKRGQRQGPQQTPQMVADYKASRDARHQSLRDKMPPVQARTSAPRQQPPAAPAPAARPSASRPSQTRPSRTTATATGSQQARPAEKKPSMGRETFDRSGKGSLGPNYGIDQFGDKNGIDMERRRAFLDAKDSQEGRKAINKLMEERRKKQRENDSTSK